MKRMPVCCVICLLGLVVHLAFYETAMAASLSDPTLPFPIYQKQGVSAAEKMDATSQQDILKLESIVIAQRERYALINGEKVRVGQRVAGAQILRIDPKQVLLRRRGESIFLELSQRPTGLVRKVN